MVKLITTYQKGIDNTDKTAIIYFDIKTNEYLVSVKNDMGITFISTFETLDEAETFARGWIND